MNCCNNNNNGNGGVVEVLETILALQTAAEIEEERNLETCDRPFLGREEPCEYCNTRPITIFTDEDRQWAIPYQQHGDTQSHKSTVFRIEKINDGALTFRVLIPGHKPGKYKATNEFFTMCSTCLCCIKCLEDTFVECL